MKNLKYVILVLCAIMPLASFSQTLSEGLSNKVSTIMGKKFFSKSAYPEVEQTLSEVSSQIGTDNVAYASLLEFYLSKINYFSMEKERLDSLYDVAQGIRERISNGASPELESLYKAHAAFLGTMFFGDGDKEKKEIETYQKWWNLHKASHPELTERDIETLESFAASALVAGEEILGQQLRRELHDIYKLTKSVTDEDYQKNVCELAKFTVITDGDTLKGIQLARTNVESLRSALADTICPMYYQAIEALATCYIMEDPETLSRQLNLAGQLYGEDSLEYQIVKGYHTTASLMQGSLRQAIADTQPSTEKPSEISLESLQLLATTSYLYGRYSDALEYNKLHLDYLLENPQASTNPFIGSSLNEIYVSNDLTMITNIYVALNDMEGLLAWAEETLPRTIVFGELNPQKYALRIAESAATSQKTEYAMRFIDLIDKYIPQYQGDDAAFILREKGYVYTYFLDGEKGPQMLEEAYNLASTPELKARIKLEQAFSYMIVDDMPMFGKSIKDALNAITQIQNYEQTQDYIVALNLSLIADIANGDFSAALDDVQKCEKYQSKNQEELSGFSNLYTIPQTLQTAPLENMLGTFSVLALAFVKPTGLNSMVIDTYLQNGMPQPTRRLLEEYIDEYHNGIISTLGLSHTLSRRLSSNMQEQYLPFMARYAATVREDFALDYLMNAALLCKSFQLNADNAIRDVVAKSSDPVVRSQYDRLLELRNSKAQQNSDAYDREIMEIEMQLKNEAKLSDQYASLLKKQWREVASALGEKEALVEFVNYPTFEGDTKYVAIVMRNKGALELVDLFGENELKNTDQDQWYKLPVITDMVWGPLAHALEDVSKIYFSPIGALHTIALESVPETSKYLPHVQQLVRLSSSNQLLRETSQPSGEVVLIGGVDYDLDTKHSSPKKSKKRGQRGIGDYLEYLPGTQNEVRNASKILTPLSDNITVVTGGDATEGWFKGLSGKDLRLLHIATHGFYIPQPRNQKDHPLMVYGVTPSVSDETEALKNSGLYLAGANNASIDTVTSEGDDGVVTSEEITSLDLLGTDLVTLSACNTAQGDISGDGVFGLQRAFKKAGVNSLLMTLWPVDDEATQKLMENFYTGLAKGMSKHQALEQAKKVIRETPGYESPEYWAAFILLDALD